jgi:acylphosphatase
VQGVFFRDTVQRRARAAGVGGWVRNRADGALEAVFEGEPNDVEAMVALCRTGPSRAVVEELEVVEEPVEGIHGFSVR